MWKSVLIIFFKNRMDEKPIMQEEMKRLASGCAYWWTGSDVVEEANRREDP